MGVAPATRHRGDPRLADDAATQAAGLGLVSQACLRTGRAMASYGFCAGWSSLVSSLPPMIIFGLANSQTVEYSWLPIQSAFAPLRTAYQQGSCCQW